MRLLVFLCCVFATAATAQDRSDRWAGLYAGAQIATGRIGTAVGDDGSISYGLHFGYRRAFGHMLFGAEIGYDQLDVTGRSGNDDHVSRLGLTAGLDRGRWMPFATVGGSSLTFRGPGSRQSSAGAFVGLGTAYAVGDHLGLSATLRHYAFDDFDHTGIDRPIDALSTEIDWQF
jgi:hypothetical protein